MRVWWPDSPRPGNLGDILTPWLMRQDGVEPSRVSRGERGKILGIGSTIRFAEAGDLVWTSGTPWPTTADTPAHGSPAATYLAVRGPLTLSAARLHGTIGRRETVPLGDGALCLPCYYQPAGMQNKDPLGIVPHYADLPHRDQWPAEWHDAKLITPLRDEAGITTFVDEVTSCERIESSSLHGCVIAEAYGVPWEYVPIDGGSRVNGRDFKFADFTLSLPMVDVPALMEARPWRS